MPRALEATVKIRLNPAVIGPDAKTEWTSDASASDYLSEILSQQQMDTVLDWGYVLGWTEVESPADYEEGEMFDAPY